MKRKNNGSVSFSEEEVLQYLNLIGLDESEFNNKIKNSNGMRLDNLSSLYDIAEANKFLPTSTSKDLGRLYEVLISILNNDLIYDTEQAKNEAMNDALYILKNVSKIQVSNDNDSFTIFERTNSLLKDILSGIICSDNIQQLKLLYFNASPRKLLGLSFNEDVSDNEKKLYQLMALSKVDYSEGINIFNDNDEIDYNRLKVVIIPLIINGVNNKKDLTDTNVKKLAFKRPSYKVLKDSESYN